MKKIILLLNFCLPIFIWGQETIINYTSLTPSNCSNIFAFETEVNNIIHKTELGGGKN